MFHHANRERSLAGCAPLQCFILPGLCELYEMLHSRLRTGKESLRIAPLLAKGTWGILPNELLMIVPAWGVGSVFI